MVLMLSACSKIDFPSDAPDCIKKIAKDHQKGKTNVTKWTNDTSIFWKIYIDPVANLADDETIYEMDDHCDTLCIIPTGGIPYTCKMALDFSKLKEIH